MAEGRKEVKDARFDLVPVFPQWETARVYGFGATKYADRNWENGYDWGKSFAASQRHQLEFWNGSTVDEESGLHPLSHAVFHLYSLMEWSHTHPEYDTRSIYRLPLVTVKYE